MRKKVSVSEGFFTEEQAKHVMHKYTRANGIGSKLWILMNDQTLAKEGFNKNIIESINRSGWVFKIDDDYYFVDTKCKLYKM